MKYIFKILPTGNITNGLLYGPVVPQITIDCLNASECTSLNAQKPYYMDERDL